MIGFAALSVLRLRKELNERRMIAWKSLGISDNDNDDDRNAKVSLPDGAERGLSS
ncbi:MAG: hypothetical protein ACRD5J_13800 [Nitrososphaeraceae archaeon]